MLAHENRLYLCPKRGTWRSESLTDSRPAFVYVRLSRSRYTFSEVALEARLGIVLNQEFHRISQVVFRTLRFAKTLLIMRGTRLSRSYGIKNP